MELRAEIERHADPADVPALLWLLGRYSWSSQWPFVAGCTHRRYGTQSYQTHRVWTPTAEGRLLYAHRDELDAPR